MHNDTETFYDLVLVTETNAAYLVRNNSGDEEWIPKSQIIDIEFGENLDVNDETLKVIETLEVPAWLAANLNL